MSRSNVAVALVLATMANTGCADFTSHTPPPTMSGQRATPRFLVVADTICHRLNIRRDRATIHVLADYVRLFGPLAIDEHRELQELRQLTPPRRMATAWQMFLSNAEVVTERTAEVAREVADKHLATAARALKALEGAKLQMTKAVAPYGFQHCAKVEDDY